MASGSWFEIIRDDNKQIVNQDFIDSFFNKYPNILKDSFISKSKTLDEIQDYFSVDENSHSVINVKNKKLYISLMKVHFNSEFDSLKKHFNMNAYNKHCQIVISYHKARKIIQAINYILSENYNKKFEEVLDNEYLESFENLYPVFAHRFQEIDKSFYDSGEYQYQCNLALAIFDRMLTILKAYVIMKDNFFGDENEYILIYNCY